MLLLLRITNSYHIYPVNGMDLLFVHNNLGPSWCVLWRVVNVNRLRFCNHSINSRCHRRNEWARVSTGLFLIICLSFLIPLSRVLFIPHVVTCGREAILGVFGKPQAIMSLHSTKPHCLYWWQLRLYTLQHSSEFWSLPTTLFPSEFSWRRRLSEWSFCIILEIRNDSLNCVRS